MKTVLQIIEEAGGLATFTWTRIENPPFMLLVIESLGKPGPNGYRALSIAHYGEQNGDAMRDPEICAEVVMENGVVQLWPSSAMTTLAWNDGTASERRTGR